MFSLLTQWHLLNNKIYWQTTDSGNQTENTTYGVSGDTQPDNTTFGVSGDKQADNTIFGVSGDKQADNTIFGQTSRSYNL